MASLAVTKNFLVVSSFSEATIIIMSTEKPEKITLSIPQYFDEKSNKNETESCDLESGKVHVKISPSGQYIAVCSGKKLTVWKTKDWTILSSRDIARSASNMIFTPNECDIVVADKSGDVYKFSLLNQESGQLVLGHLSVVLDVLLTKDEKFVLTCDRDEKIRVSNFPNCYNIHSFCLGHKEFVSCMKFAPHDENILISGSGDGTVKFWRFSEGSELLSYCLTSLPSDVISPHENTSLAVSFIDGLKIDYTTSLVCLTISAMPKIIILLFKSDNGEINCSYHSFIPTTTEPISFTISETYLWILCSDIEANLSVFLWLNEENQFTCKKDLIDGLFSDIRVDLQKLFIMMKKQDSIDYLFKKKYDNVQEYLVKKKARIEGSL